MLELQARVEVVLEEVRVEVEVQEEEQVQQPVRAPGLVRREEREGRMAEANREVEGREERVEVLLEV